MAFFIDIDQYNDSISFPICVFVQLRLLRIRNEHGQTIREESLRGRRRSLARFADEVWNITRECDPLRPKHWHSTNCRLGFKVF